MDDQQERRSGGDSRAVDLDIPSLAQALQQKLEVWRQNHSDGSQPCTPTIGMVHDLTRNVDEHQYNPHYVSIGPYHRKRAPSIIREDDKLRSLEAFLASRPGPTVQTYLEELAPNERRARNFYAHSFSEMKSPEFLVMLLLDACYVLHWFALASRRGNELETVSVVRDVFYLAENQIPYFVIDNINSLTSSGGRASAAQAIAGYVSCYILQKQQYSMETVPDDSEPPRNLLHLLHMHFRKPSNESSSATGEQVGRCRTAMEYYINGVNFKSLQVGPSDMDARCILDVTMDRGSGTLVLPRLNIDGETWRILRNLMALEQQNPDVGSHVTAYCIFMSQLACTERDVEFLSRSGVIVHTLGNNKEAAKLFSDLCKGVVFDANEPVYNYLRVTCQALDELYRSRPRRWMALLVQKYSNNPWLVVGVIAASLGLLCTIVQAIYAVLSYHPGAVN